MNYWLRLGLFGAAVSGAASCGLLAYLIHLQLNILTTPHRNLDIGEPLALYSEDITLTTADNWRISGWYIPGDRPQAILLAHGLNTNRGVMRPQAEMLHEAGYALLLLDLRGHGYSQAARLTYGYNEALDVVAGIEYLLARPEIEQVGLLGASMGGAAVVRAAALDGRAGAVVVETSYSSLTAAAEDAFEELTIFPRRPFAPLVIGLAERQTGVRLGEVDSVRDLAALSCPVLIIHAADDQLFPPAHAHRMYEAAGSSAELWIIEDTDHANPALARPVQYRQRVIDFFEAAFAE